MPEPIPFPTAHRGPGDYTLTDFNPLPARWIELVDAANDAYEAAIVAIQSGSSSEAFKAARARYDAAFAAVSDTEGHRG